jgi:hypothetical protein
MMTSQKRLKGKPLASAVSRFVMFFYRLSESLLHVLLLDVSLADKARESDRGLSRSTQSKPEI